MICLITMLLFAPVHESIVRLPNFQLLEVLREQRFIEDHDLQKVRLSCYIAKPGAVCADGTVPHEGVISCNREHLGQKCVMYDKDLQEVATWECHDVGGNSLLRAGKAIDVYRDNLERCYELIGQYGDYVYIEWLEE